MLTTKVKAGQITNLTDARYFAAMGVDWLGFSVDPAATNHVAPKQMQEMIAWLEGPAIVGEFSIATAETIRESFELLNLDFVQLGHFYQLESAKALTGIPIIKEIIVADLDELNGLTSVITPYLPYVSMIIIDLSKNNLSVDSKEGMLKYLKNLCKIFPILLKLSNNASTTGSILKSIEPMGIEVVGGEEEAVGVKSFDELDELFDILMIEE